MRDYGGLTQPVNPVVFISLSNLFIYTFTNIMHRGLEQTV